jgi:hypothetical protein
VRDEPDLFARRAAELGEATMLTGAPAFRGSHGVTLVCTAAFATQSAPRPIHTACTPNPRSMSGPTANWPAEPPSIPMDWVAPTAVAR